MSSVDIPIPSSLISIHFPSGSMTISTFSESASHAFATASVKHGGDVAVEIDPEMVQGRSNPASSCKGRCSPCRPFRFPRSLVVIPRLLFDDLRGNQRFQMPMELERQLSALYEDAELHVALHRGGGQIRTGDESQFAVGDGTFRMNGSRQLSGQRLPVRRPDVNVDRGREYFSWP